MKKKSKARAGMNTFQCPVVVGERRNKYTGRVEKVHCAGTGFLPIPLTLLAKIRTFGSRIFRNVQFTCKYHHDITLDP